MKRAIAGLFTALLLAPLGCNQSSTPGGPGVASSGRAETTANRPTYGEAERTFEISVPMLSTNLKQGETKSATISLSRGKDFNEDVSLQLNNIPEGVTVEPTAPKIMHGDKDVKLNLTASADAAVGDFTIDVVGHPNKGADATNTMKLSVSKQ